MRYNGTSDIYILVDKNLQHFKISNDLSYSVNIFLALFLNLKINRLFKLNI